MSTAEGDPTADELLRHARWIRRLAGALLRDEAAADDLVQDAMVAALTRPPAAGRLRPWLREVARNFARQHHRGKARRAAREAVARPPRGEDGPDELAQRLEAEQRLTRELAALPEPFRTTLLLRYYEDLEPADIATRLGLPGGTVRWRLARGLALLRERLDRASGGDRRAWSVALLPLARLDGSAALAGAATASATVFSGVVLMNVLKLSVAASALLVVALGLSLSGVLPEGLTLGRRERPLEVTFRPLTLADAGPAEVELDAAAPEAAGERAVLAAPEAPGAAVAPTDLAVLDARLVAAGRPVAGARLIARRGDTAREARSDADGLATAALALAEPRELVSVEIGALGFASQTREAVCTRGATTHLGRIELVPGGAVSGRVADEHGRPLADVLITLGTLDERLRDLEAARLASPRRSVPSARSDARGAFRLAGVPAGMARLWAHADGRKASYTPPLEVRAGQESLGVELVLEPLAAENVLHGVVLDPTGAPVPRARLEYRHSLNGGSTVRSGEDAADAEGRFEFRLPADARTWLRATDPNGRFAAASAEDVPNGPRELVLTLREARTVELVVTGRGRAPLESFAVELRGVDARADLAELAAELGRERAAEAVAASAPRLGGLPRGPHADGRARVAVPDQPFFVRVLAPGHRALALGPLEPERLGATLACALEPVPGLAGVVLRGGAPLGGVRVELRSEVEPDLEVVVDGVRQRVHPDLVDEAVTDVEGRFLLTPRAPGRYVVRAVPGSGASAEVGPVEVDAGLGGPPLEVVLGLGGAIEGRVRLASGADPEGAIVGVTRGGGDDRTQRVGSDGRFRFDALVPGPWRVELREREVFGEPRSISTTRGPHVRPFELGATCTVFEGETTHVDVSDVPAAAVGLTGRLRIDERAAVGWLARLGPAGVLEFEEGAWTPLDSDGAFELQAPAPGRYRLALRVPAGERQEQYLFEDLDLTRGDERWERELHTGTLRLAGAAAWDGDGVPPLVHLWRGTGQLFVLTAPVAGGDAALSVPAGPGELRAPVRSPDIQDWPVVREVDVPRGGEAVLDARGLGSR